MALPAAHSSATNSGTWPPDRADAATIGGAMTATLDHSPTADRVSGPASRIEVVPDAFRLRDVNPLTGRSYAESRTYELPPYVLDAIEVEHRVGPSTWNSLVRSGQVAAVLDLDQPLSLVGFLNAIRIRDRAPNLPEAHGQVCVDCWGTFAVLDKDSSLTGCADSVCLCWCASAPMVVPPSWH